MPRITLPDGSVKEFDRPVSGREVAESIGPRLAKAALGVKVNGELRDLDWTIDGDATVAIVTERNRDGTPDPDALLLMRHSAAHVMAEAIQRIIPGAQLVYGPPLPTGFYYDIAVPEETPIREGDFERVEQEIAAILKEDRPFTRYELPAGEGLAKLKQEGSKYKLDNAERAIEAMKQDPGSESRATLSWYATGQPGKNWEDLCRGPHVPSTARIGAVKILSVASSYWHGDETSDRLTRVYGTAFPSQKELDEHLHQLEEAKKRDHRVIGKHLRLFHIDEDVGQGLILWTPNGAIVRKQLQDFISEELRKQGYFEVFTPHIGNLELYRISGHFPYYKESQYPPIYLEASGVAREAAVMAAANGDTAQFESLKPAIKALDATEGRQTKGLEQCTCAEIANSPGLLLAASNGYLLKPMNCPHHIKIYDSAPRSYRDLPLRLSEFGTVYRWEQSGELNGMTRVRGFTQDDAHIFCTPEQVASELALCLSLVRLIFDTLGMRDYRVRVGLRDPDSTKYVGNPENWQRAEDVLREAARAFGAPFTEEPGEAAFYGPKIDFVVKDVIGREWQLGTVQVDYNLPERFDLSYTGADNHPHRPVMIHRAPFGSMERFCGVLIEHFAGAFPTWLAPEQVRVLPISQKSEAYAQTVLAALRERRLRASADLSGDRIQAKVRAAAEEKIPYMLVVGPRDEENGVVSVRARGIQKDLGALPLERFAALLAEEVDSRGKATVTAAMGGA